MKFDKLQRRLEEYSNRINRENLTVAQFSFDAVI